MGNDGKENGNNLDRQYRQVNWVEQHLMSKDRKGLKAMINAASKDAPLTLKVEGTREREVNLKLHGPLCC